jgi:hypothetical protein
MAAQPNREAPRDANRQNSQSNISTDRAKLGLGLKPSEMIAGLDDVAKRVEKQQQRETEKRRLGGKMNPNEALQTDGTGRRWQRNVIIAIVVVALLGGVGFIAAIVTANFHGIDPREGNVATRRMMSELIGYAQRLQFEENANPSGDKIRELLREQVDLQLKQVEADIDRDQQRREREGKHRPPDSRLYRDRDNLVDLVKLQDPWGQPLRFEVEKGILTIHGKGKPEGGAIEPLTTTLPIKKAK